MIMPALTITLPTTRYDGKTIHFTTNNRRGRARNAPTKNSN
jgi:hypothetical protein